MSDQQPESSKAWYQVKSTKSVNLSKPDFDKFTAFVGKHFPQAENFTAFVRLLVNSDSLPVLANSLPAENSNEKQISLDNQLTSAKNGVVSLELQVQELKKQLESANAIIKERENFWFHLGENISRLNIELNEAFKVLFNDPDCPNLEYSDIIELAIDYANSDPAQEAIKIVESLFLPADRKSISKKVIEACINLQFPRQEIAKTVYERLKAKTNENKEAPQVEVEEQKTETSAIS